MTDRDAPDVLGLLLDGAPPLPPGYAPSVLRRARRHRRNRRVAAVAGSGGLAVALGAVAVLTARPEPDRAVRIVDSPAPAPAPTPTPTPSPVARVPDGTAVEAAAIRELGPAIRAGRRLPVLFVLDRRYDGIVVNPGGPSPAAPIGPDEQDALRAALADYAPVEFVASRDAAYVPGAGEVRDGGVLVTLGRVAWPGPDRATLELSAEAGGKAGRGLTYVLVRSEGRWKVTGTTGTEWIS